MACTLATRLSMRYVYHHSDAYVLLSESFREAFRQITGIKNPTRVRVISNPLALSGHIPEFSSKKKEVLYVGRLERIQKRTDRVLQVWGMLQERFPEWSLKIVGDGPDRTDLETSSRRMNLKRVSFEGFQDPEDYYRCASLLLMTSDFEGFPLVLCETMHFGTPPVVYGSFASLGDVVENGKSGIITDQGSEFSAKNMADAAATLMSDSIARFAYYKHAIERSRHFDIKRIVDEWENLFLELSRYE